MCSEPNGNRIGVGDSSIKVRPNLIYQKCYDSRRYNSVGDLNSPTLQCLIALEQCLDKNEFVQRVTASFGQKQNVKAFSRHTLLSDLQRLTQEKLKTATLQNDYQCNSQETSKVTRSLISS